MRLEYLLLSDQQYLGLAALGLLVEIGLHEQLGGLHHVGPKLVLPQYLVFLVDLVVGVVHVQV